MGSPNLEIGVETTQGVSVVVLNGPIDSNTYDQFRKQMNAVINRPGARVVVDCANLSYVNSRAIALLVTYHRTCFQRRGMMALCNVDRRMVKTMDLLGLGSVLRFFPSREEALSSFT